MIEVRDVVKSFGPLEVLKGVSFAVAPSEVAVIIGQGNVAIDVCRVLAKTVDELKHTDIAAHALECLAASRIREIHLIGRRGPAQAKFTTKEFRELGELADCDPVVDPADLELNTESMAELEDRAGSVAKKNLEVLKGFASRPARPTRRGEVQQKSLASSRPS